MNGILPRALRVFSAAALLLALGALFRPGRAPARALAVVLDDSASMAVPAGDPFPLSRRWDRAVTLAASLGGRPFRGFVVGDGLRAVADFSKAEPTAGRSRVSALRELRSLAPETDAVLFISDGRAERPEEALTAASSLGLPVYAVAVGREAADVAVAEVQSPPLVFAGADTEVRVRTVRRGAPAPVELSLWDGRRRLAAAPVASTAPEAETRLPFRPTGAGLRLLRVEATVLPGEFNRENNVRLFPLDVRRDRLRVLYLCGRPGPHYGFLRAQLKTDPAVELVSFVILRDPEDALNFPEADLSLIPFPSPDRLLRQLKTFDVVVLEDFPPASFGLGPRLPEALRDFVRRGGGLLLAGEGGTWADGGPGRGNALEFLIPPGGYRPGPAGRWAAQVTAPGHPVMALAPDAAGSLRRWRDLPPLESPEGFPWPVLAGGTPLAEGPGRAPYLSIREEGRGRVLLMSVLSDWRWALAGARGPWAYQRFWENAMRWLGGSPDQKDLRFMAEEGPAPVGQPGTVSVRFTGQNAPAAVRVTATGGGKAAFGAVLRPPAGSPGVYAGSLTFPAPGFYDLRARAGATEARAIVQASAGWDELFDTRPDGAFMERLAQATGGVAVPDEEFSAGRFRRWLARAGRPAPQNDGRAAPWFWLAAVCLALEWVLRRRGGQP